jgi:hypothetical protein
MIYQFGCLKGWLNLENIEYNFDYSKEVIFVINDEVNKKKEKKDNGFKLILLKEFLWW